MELEASWCLLPCEVVHYDVLGNGVSQTTLSFFFFAFFLSRPLKFMLFIQNFIFILLFIDINFDPYFFIFNFYSFFYSQISICF